MVFYSTSRNSSYYRPKECCFFDPVSCLFLLHIRLIINKMPICENVKNTWAAMGKLSQHTVPGAQQRQVLLDSLELWLFKMGCLCHAWKPSAVAIKEIPKEPKIICVKN